MAGASQFVEDCLCLDLELGRDGRLHHLGALFQDRVFERRGRLDPAETLQRLGEFARGARYLLGHNLIAHDLPALARLVPRSPLLKLQVVDTLYLSPLAFPENPYHRLVKDYKLVKASVNDPVADARLAAGLFVEQWDALAGFEPELLEFFAACFRRARGFDGTGLATVFGLLAAGAPEMDQDPAAAWVSLTDGKCCPKASSRLVQAYAPTPQRWPTLAYCMAWLRVAGGNSVLPPWVRHQFPDVVDALRQLRDVHCGAEDCAYCRHSHDPEHFLHAFFGFHAFRSLPDGTALQRELVAAGMADEPLLGILPTGGGKSLCFQVPALVRYQRRGTLTVVISPLQALMKDQVDNLVSKTGSHAVAAIYGMLTPPERSDALARVRLGDVAILYLSPEQLRNRSLREAISQREIGCWVFDEAHCVSKWGHDFRPDYLYAARFIRELSTSQKLPVPPIACFTATAKQEVIEEIIAHFDRVVGQRLRLFRGTVERENLRFEVRSIAHVHRGATVIELLKTRLPEPGAAIVYCATRKRTEELASLLAAEGIKVEAFHAGLEAPNKRRIQDAFVDGSLRVICATNAFGMGIDKEDVRLVIHADIPGSLENYLQEAGRAGRDLREAECILLYDEEDIETQFKLAARSQISQRSIQQILRYLRNSPKDAEGNVVLTSGELLRDDAVDELDADLPNADTKVKAAVAWLERAGFVERNENHTRVFQGRPVCRTLEEAEAKLDKLQLAPKARTRWLAILGALYQADPDEGLSTDEIALLPGVISVESGGAKRHSQEVLRSLQQMAQVGLIRQGAQLTAFLRPNGKGNGRLVFKQVAALERAMLRVLREEAPDDHDDVTQRLSLRRLNQRLVDADSELASVCSPELLRSLLGSLSQDGQGLAGSRGSLLLKYASRDTYAVRLQRSWSDIVKISELRRAVASVCLDTLVAASANASPTGCKEVLVHFALDDLVQAVQRDMSLGAMVKDPLAAIERGLMYLHEQRAITLQRGLAVFRQAMTIQVQPEAKGRRYTRGDFAPLAKHYSERIFHVHVMDRYAKLAQEKLGRALALTAAYFTLGREEFVRRFFAGHGDMLERATSEASFLRIVESLANPEQIAVVAASMAKNALVLAGPGSGKTRVVVHRAAYLLRVQRVAPQAILILAFNYNAAVELRRRLRELVGNDARGVAVHTYHGLAMRLTGASFAVRAEQLAADQVQSQQRLDGLIPEAVALLRGDKEVPGFDAEALREQILRGYEHILVDEYQDIDQTQYDLISALAGRTLSGSERKLHILAVGDDDQSIYGFREANVRFIRQFQQDYRAQLHPLVENYRATGHIIAAANALIVHNHDRIKQGRDIRINRERALASPGAPWDRIDRVVRGRVQVLKLADVGRDQALAVVDELERLRSLTPDCDWSDFAVLGRRGLGHPELASIRATAEARGIPVAWKLDAGATFALHRVRELFVFLQALAVKRHEQLTPDEIAAMAGGGAPVDSVNDWQVLLSRLLESWRDQSGPVRRPCVDAREYFYEALAEQRREHRVGHGVLLSTAHGAKGMEAKHVIVADGGWRRPYDSSALEEERRLYYVAMTRAKHTLTLMWHPQGQNPHVPLVQSGAPVLEREVANTAPPPPLPALRDACYELLSLRQLDLDFAGRLPPSHPVHKALGTINSGDLLRIEQRHDEVLLCAADGQAVARLSREGRERFVERHRGTQGHATTARVVAMLQRHSDDARSEDFRDRHRAEHWQVPVVELQRTSGAEAQLLPTTAAVR